jgi:hypothetical protein
MGRRLSTRRIDFGRGSRRRIRGLRARDHTSVGLLLFIVAVFVSACVLAAATGRCSRHRLALPTSRITSAPARGSGLRMAEQLAPDLRHNPMDAVPELWN